MLQVSRQIGEIPKGTCSNLRCHSGLTDFQNVIS
ncbi:MAG TPA: hypothetical protein DD426_13760 [Clostridiaceae bacterium]|nr:hypothetical protein [Clostridiaceae bacterium]